MAIKKNRENEFFSALARLEACLEAPLVPGELPSWLSDVGDRFAQLDKLFRQEVEVTHAQLLLEIASEDVSLTPRVEDLKSTDEELCATWERLRNRLEQLRRTADRAEPNEAKLENQLDRFVEEAIAFVIDARKQDAALTTWHLEALERDRGIAD